MYINQQAGYSPINIIKMKFQKAIITENEHIYDARENLSCRMVRAIVPNKGLQFDDDKLYVYVQVFGLKVEDGKDVLFNLPNLGNTSVYDKLELDTVFTMLGTPILPSGSFLEQFNSLILNFLIADTMQSQMFNNDNVTPYTN